MHLRRIIPLALTALAAATIATPAMATSLRWHAPVRIEPARNGGLSGVSCPSAKLCVAVDQSGFVVTTKNPAGGAKAWSSTVRIDPRGSELTGISCPSTVLCVAVDANGYVISSKNPTGGAKTWSRVHVDSTTAPDGGPAGFTGISCPSVKLCAAVDGGSPANVVTSTNPTGGASAWKLAAVGGILTSISCPTASFCVAAGSQHYVSSAPTAGASAWKATGTQTGGGVFSSIDCPSTSLCIAGGYGDTSTGLITSSAAPRGGASAWTTSSPQGQPPNPGAGLIDDIGCLSAGFCVATDSADNVFVSTKPASGVWGSQTAIARASGATSDWSAIGCSTTLCVVVDSNGYAVAGTKRG